MQGAYQFFMNVHACKYKNVHVYTTNVFLLVTLVILENV